MRKAPRQGSPRGGRLRQPPGEFRLFPAVPARALHSQRALSPHPTPPSSFWALAILHAGASSCPTRPHFHLVGSRPTLPTPSLCRSSQSPATPELPELGRAIWRAVRGARDPVTIGAATRRTGGGLRPRASPRAGPRLAGRLAPGPRSRARRLQRPRARRAAFAPARARALCAGWLTRTRPSGLRGGAKSSSPG